MTNLKTLICFDEPQRTKEAIKIATDLMSRYEMIGFGKDRIAFKMRGGYIFKFPRHETGEYCNDGEGSWKDETFATSRYVEYKGFVCVMQEALDIKAPFEKPDYKLPDWTMSIDCCQVGFDKRGNLKAYDFVHA